MCVCADGGFPAFLFVQPASYRSARTSAKWFGVQLPGWTPKGPLGPREQIPSPGWTPETQKKKKIPGLGMPGSFFFEGWAVEVSSEASKLFDQMLKRRVTPSRPEKMRAEPRTENRSRCRRSEGDPTPKLAFPVGFLLRQGEKVTKCRMLCSSAWLRACWSSKTARHDRAGASHSYADFWPLRNTICFNLLINAHARQAAVFDCRVSRHPEALFA